MPYRKEVIGDCTLYLGDTMDIVPILDKVDAVILDPPYLLSNSPPGKRHYGMNLRKFESKGFTDIVAGFDNDIFPLLGQICDPFNMFCFCSNRQISQIMAFHESKGRVVTLLVWHKINAAPFANGVWRGDIEYIIHARDKGATFIGNAQDKCKVTPLPIVQDAEHPTVKPLSLIMKYINICSNEGDTILDCYLGTGTTLVGCAMTGRKGIGIEIDEKHFNTACERVENAYKQPRLFKSPPQKQDSLL